jgi:hypothetical protein
MTREIEAMSKHDGKRKKQTRKRRSKWAADLEHLIPGSEAMTDEQLETAVLRMLDRNF